MIILDTNVISAVMNSKENPIVVSWFNQQPARDLCTTSMSFYELHFGIELLPASARKQKMMAALSRVLGDIQNRILFVDAMAAEQAAALEASRVKKGKPEALADTFIAGIALANNAAIATRNMKHFQDVGVKLINPWEMA